MTASWQSNTDIRNTWGIITNNNTGHCQVYIVYTSSATETLTHTFFYMNNEIAILYKQHFVLLQQKPTEIGNIIKRKMVKYRRITLVYPERMRIDNYNDMEA